MFEGVKRPGVGWPKCCPPKGCKRDVVAALQRKRLLLRDLIDTKNTDSDNIGDGAGDKVSGKKDFRDTRNDDKNADEDEDDPDVVDEDKSQKRFIPLHWRNKVLRVE